MLSAADDAGLPEHALLQLVRVYADNLRRVAEAEVRLFHDYVHERLRAQGLSAPELMATIDEISEQLLSAVEPAVLYFQRKGWVSATGRARTVSVAPEALRRRGLRLEYLTIVWNVIEALVAIAAGLAAGSIALVGFGFDSSIEMFAATVVVWHFRSEQRGGFSEEREQRALRLIAVAFFALAGIGIAVLALREGIEAWRGDED